MLGSAIALVVNYRSVAECNKRLEALAEDVLPTAIVTMGAGVFSGVLTGGGMATALANSIAGIIASMVGQAFRLISPVITVLYMLCGETKQNFVDFQKEYLKYFWVVIVTYLVVYGLTGALPY